MYLAVLHVVVPVSLILCPVGVVEGAIPVADPFDELPVVGVSERVLRPVHPTYEPDVLPQPVLHPVLPLAYVHLVSVHPLHRAVTWRMGGNKDGWRIDVLSGSYLTSLYNTAISI